MVGQSKVGAWIKSASAPIVWCWSCSPCAVAACAGLAAVAVNRVVLTWELAQMDILTMRVTTYTGSMAASEKLSTKTANPKAWVLVMPQTDSETVLETVCTQ